MFRHTETSLWSSTSFFNIKWPPDLPQADFEMNCREQGLHCEFPITIENTIIMLAVKKRVTESCTGNWSERMQTWNQCVKQPEVSKIVKQGSEMMASGNSRRWAADWKGEQWNKQSHQARTVQYDQQQAQKQHRQTSNQIWLHRVWNQAHPLGGLCPARGKYWLRCGKSNHFIRVHPSRKPNHTAVQVRALTVGLDPSKSHPGSWRSLVLLWHYN